MKLERRGKYPGVKVHLEKDECVLLMEPKGNWLPLVTKLIKNLTKLAKEEPTLLEDRSEEEILATLSKEAIESDLKLKAIGKGADWKKVKVQIEP